MENAIVKEDLKETSVKQKLVIKTVQKMVPV